MTTRSKKMIHRERLWEIAQQIDDHNGEAGWGAKDLSYAFHRSLEYVRSAIKDWEHWGYITLIREQGRRKFYRVNRDKAGQPPVTDQAGKVVREATPQQNMWRAMRTLSPHSFSYQDVWQHANTPSVAVDRAAAHAYCRMLANAGYLKVTQKANGRGRLARYKLVRNTGPLPPREKRVRGVWDENDQQFIYVAGGAQA